MARQYQMIGFINEGSNTREYQVGGAVVNEVIPLLAGGLTLDDVTDTTADISSAASTGGTVGKTYQWHRSTSAGFSPSGANDLPGETALTLADTGLTAATTYYYKLVVTDAHGVTDTSDELEVETDAPLTAPTQARLVASGAFGFGFGFGFG